MQECPEEEQWLEEDEDGFLAQISTCFMQLRQECAADEQKDAKAQHSCIVFFCIWFASVCSDSTRTETTFVHCVKVFDYFGTTGRT